MFASLRRNGRASRANVRPPYQKVAPFRASFLREFIVVIVALKIAAEILVISTGYDGAQVPKQIVSVAFAFLLLAALGLAVTSHGTAIFPRTRLHIFIAVFVTASVGSAAFAEDRYVAFFGDATRLEGLLFLGDMVVLYMAVAVAYRYPRDWLVLGAAFAVATAVAMIYAVVQYAGLDPLKWSENARSRPIATFGNANLFAQFLSVVFAAALGVSLLGDRRLRAAAIPLGIGSLALSTVVAARAVLLGFGAAFLGSAVLYSALRGISRRSFVRLAISGALGSAIMIVAVWSTPLGSRLRGSFTGDSYVTDRLFLWGSAWRAFLERPIFGWGPDGFAPAYVANRSVESTLIFGPSFATSGHSWVAQTAVSLGTVGVIALVGLIVAFGWSLLRHCSSGDRPVAGTLLLILAAYYADGLVSVQSVNVDWVPWVVFGGTAALTTEEVQPRVFRQLRPLIGTVVVLASLAVGLFGWRAWQANVDASGAAAATEQGRVGDAIERGASAVSLDPGRARYWNLYGNALAIGGRYAEASASYAAAAARVPYNAEYWANLAKARALEPSAGDPSGGGTRAALAAVEEGLRRDPNNPNLYETLAIVQDLSGEPEAALSSIIRALELWKGDKHYWTTLATVAEHVTDPTVALRSLRQALAMWDGPVVRIAAGRAALRAGDLRQAEEHARRALEMEPRDAEAHELLRFATTTAR